MLHEVAIYVNYYSTLCHFLTRDKECVKKSVLNPSQRATSAVMHRLCLPEFLWCTVIIVTGYMYLSV